MFAHRDGIGWSPLIRTHAAGTAGTRAATGDDPAYQVIVGIPLKRLRLRSSNLSAHAPRPQIKVQELVESGVGRVVRERRPVEEPAPSIKSKSGLK